MRTIFAALLICALAATLAWESGPTTMAQAGATPQQPKWDAQLRAMMATPPPAKMARVVAILREASAIVPQVPQNNRSSIADDIAIQQVRAGDVRHAMETYRLGGEKSPAPAGIAVGLAQRGEAAAAFQWMENVPPPALKGMSYQWMSWAFQERGDFSSALEAGRLAGKCCADSSTYRDIFIGAYQAQLQAGDRAGATATMKELLATVYKGFENKPDPQILADIAGALSKGGDQDRAREVRDRIAALSDGQPAFNNALAQADAFTGNFAEARELLKTPNLWRAATALLTIAIGEAKQGDFDGAIATIRTMPGGQYSNSVERVADALAASGDFVKAEKMLTFISNSDDRSCGLGLLAWREVQTAPALAVETATRVLQAAQNSPCVQGLQAVAETFAQLGDIPSALKAAKLEDDANIDPAINYMTSIDAIMEALVRQHKIAEALALARGSERAKHDAWLRAHYLQWLAKVMMDAR